MAPFSNACAKYVHLGSTFAVFLEHVWRFSSHATCILHTCSKNTSIAKVGKYLGKRWSKRFRSSTKTTYSSSTCANKSADRRVVFETITFPRRIRYIFAPWDHMLCFWYSVYFPNTCAEYKYQLAWHIRNHHFPSKNTLHQGHAMASQARRSNRPAARPAASQPASQLASQQASQP